MLKKLFLHFWSVRHQFVRYFVIGLGAVVLDIGSLYLLKEYLHLRPVMAVIVNGIFILNYVFFLNKYWAFKSTGITHKQMIRFFILAGANYGIAIAWMYIFNHQLGLNYLIVRLANIALSVTWNFLLYKFWVYKHEEPTILAN
ncbi:MAG: Uncharacterized protein G01um101413_173 [Parcubacteria group bacterium Gr01-1014_13]|nr:MAG: Uncharacterized protein G01um101413_173 [Parcubacteria group bacterium Gr01-1014_13]